MISAAKRMNAWNLAHPRLNLPPSHPKVTNAPDIAAKLCQNKSKRMKETKEIWGKREGK